MSKTALQALTGKDKESKADKIRRLIPDIRDAMARKVTQAVIAATIAEEHQIKLSVDELRNALYREKQRTRSQADAPATPTPKTTPAAATPGKPSTRPARLDWQQQRDQGNENEW